MTDTTAPNAFANLTNNLIFIILSFLPFKEAVRTSILSKQWRSAWKSTTRIEFHEDFFVKNNVQETQRIIQRQRFIEFTHQFMINFAVSFINSFSVVLSNPGNFSPDLIREFIYFAISRNVKELSLDFHDPNWTENDPQLHPPFFHLPDNFYLHTSLQSLTLFSCNFRVPDIYNLVNLKQLSLGWVELGGSMLRGILHSCPFLEDLTLKNCWGIGSIDIQLTNLRLHRLVIDKCLSDQATWLNMDVPNLKYWKFMGNIGQFHFDHATKLVEVELGFIPMEDEYIDNGELLYQLLLQLYAARILTVDSYLLQLIPHNFEEPSHVKEYMSVEHLTFNTALHSNEFLGIKFMLRSCPLLKTLTLNIGPSGIFPNWIAPSDFDPGTAWTGILTVYNCFRRTLKVVNVKSFTGANSQLQFLTYIIRMGRVLEQVNIYLANFENPSIRYLSLRLAHVIQQVPRRSRNLEVSIYQ